jgi:hypothetical protein
VKAIIGERKKPEALVFSLPSPNGANKREIDDGYQFSAYAQAVIAADATDKASWTTSYFLATHQITTTTAYKKEFANQFRNYVTTYMPGTTMSI